jgi:hypothetical protein
MLNPERLILAIRIHSQSYDLLRWIATAVEKGKLPLERAEQHSDGQWLIPMTAGSRCWTG